MNVLKSALLLALAVPFAAHADSRSANFGVQLTVQNSCTIAAGNTAADMDFGTVTGNVTGNLDATTTLTVNCNNGALYHVGLNDGLNAATGQRRLASAANPGQFVNYELYTDSTHTTRWGATAAGGTATDWVGAMRPYTVSVWSALLPVPSTSVAVPPAAVAPQRVVGVESVYSS